MSLRSRKRSIFGHTKAATSSWMYVLFGMDAYWAFLGAIVIISFAFIVSSGRQGSQHAYGSINELRYVEADEALGNPFPLQKNVLLKTDILACSSEKTLRDISSLPTRALYEKAMLRGLLERKCQLLKAGEPVFVEDIKVWEGLVRIKLNEGRGDVVWTYQRAVH